MAAGFVLAAFPAQAQEKKPNVVTLWPTTLAHTRPAEFRSPWRRGSGR
jgi:hypothetical protein